MTLTTLSHRSSLVGLAFIAVLSVAVACRSTPTGPSATGIDDDAALFRLINETDAFTRYSTFPNAEEFAMGRLSGSEAHAPVVRVRLNATAAAVLVNGRLPAGGTFPDGLTLSGHSSDSSVSRPTAPVSDVTDSAGRS